MKIKSKILAGTFALVALAAASIVSAADAATPATPAAPAVPTTAQSTNMGCCMMGMNMGAMNNMDTKADASPMQKCMMMGGTADKAATANGTTPAHDMSTMQHK